MFEDLWRVSQIYIEVYSIVSPHKAFLWTSSSRALGSGAVRVGVLLLWQYRWEGGNLDQVPPCRSFRLKPTEQAIFFNSTSSCFSSRLCLVPTCVFPSLPNCLLLSAAPPTLYVGSVTRSPDPEEESEPDELVSSYLPG